MARKFHITRNCEHCGNPFSASTSKKVFCSNPCRARNHDGKKYASRVIEHLIASGFIKVEERSRALEEIKNMK